MRVELNPQPLFKYGIGLEDVRAALASANANSPKGAIEDGGQHCQIYTNDQALSAADYKPLILAYRNGAPVQLSDVADVIDSVENVRNAGSGQRQAGGARAAVPPARRQHHRHGGPGEGGAAAAERGAAERRSGRPSRSTARTTIRASLHDTELTLLMAVALVTLVVFLFLRDGRATLIPSVAVPISIVGTFGAMYLLGYSLDNLSLMALTVATGFVVDDAIVVLENIPRHIEDGVPRHAGGAARARARSASPSSRSACR